YSYTAAIFSLISPDITLDYRDYQARVTYDVSDHDRLSLFAFGAYDYLSSTTDDIETVIFGSEFYRFDGRYDVRLPRGGKLRTAFTWGYDRTRVADGRNTKDISFGGRFQLDEPLGDTLTLRTGLDVQHDLYSADPRPYVDPDDPSAQAFDDLFPPRTDGAAGAWADVVWQLDPRFTVTPGVRVDAFQSNGAAAASVDPRLAVEVEVAPGLRLLHAIGMAHQPPSFVVPLPGLSVAKLEDGLQTSLQASAGVEVALPWSLTATATAFDSVFFDMTDTLGVRTDGQDFTQIPRSLGGAKGFELYLRRSLASRLGGFIAYTFSRTTRTVDGRTFAAGFDRPHVLHAAVSADLGRGWRAGTRFSVYSGAPLVDSLTLATGELSRDPPFYRIDLRVEKKWRFAETGWISFVVEMVNTTLNTETINGNAVGPVTIPSLGAEGGF
ncbi:MAG TPA: TonB-dependent receptor, partial [Polyangiaceae bacterium]|nr:TonB-dependent receptor [Polyangiaceae bacterium]